MLYTNLNHIEKADDLSKIISQYENVMVICGRMGPMCIQTYRIAEVLEPGYKNIRFFDMEFDNPESEVIKKLPEVLGFNDVPITVYYKNGKAVRATTSFQTMNQVKSIIEEEFNSKITR